MFQHIETRVVPFKRAKAAPYLPLGSSDSTVLLRHAIGFTRSWLLMFTGGLFRSRRSHGSSVLQRHTSTINSTRPACQHTGLGYERHAVR